MKKPYCGPPPAESGRSNTRSDRSFIAVMANGLVIPIRKYRHRSCCCSRGNTKNHIADWQRFALRLVDHRKGLLAKVSPETLDLIDDPALFVPGTPDLFGKKFKKAVFKDLKLSKEMDSLISTRRHGNGRKQFKPFQPFRQQPGKGPGYNPRS